MSGQARPNTGDGQNTNVWAIPGVLATLVAVACAFGAWSLLLPVLPTAVLEHGGSATLAGGTTGIFMAATVATQVFTPWMLRRFGYRPVMAVAAFMLGVPALGHTLGMDAWIVLLFSALRGTGFGAITVAQSALVAELVPARLLGKATGLIGVFIGLSQMVGLPLGLFLADAFSYNTVFVVAAVVASVAAVMCLRIPALKADPAPLADPAADVAPTPMWKLVAVPALALLTISMSFGAVSSFLPAAVEDLDAAAGSVLGGFMLSIVGGASLVFRYLVGMAADRSGQPGRLLVPSQLLALAGMALMTATVVFGWSVWLLVLAALLFGGGFGAVQNESLLAMFQRTPRSKLSEASAVWNIFYDTGTGLGSVVFGAVASMFLFSGAFGAGAAVIVLGLVITVADRILGIRRGRVTPISFARPRRQITSGMRRNRRPRRPGFRRSRQK